MINVAKFSFFTTDQSTRQKRSSIFRLAYVASLLMGCSPASAGLFDNLLSKAQEIAKPAAASNASASRPEVSAQSKRTESAFSVDQLLAINELQNPEAAKQLSATELGNAAEFDPIICNSVVKQLTAMKSVGSLIFGKKKLTADAIEHRLSECRFSQTKAALGQMAGLLYSAMGNAADPGSIANSNDSAKALWVIASAFADSGNFPKAIEASKISIKKAENSIAGISESVTAIRTMVFAMVSQGDRSSAEAELTRFIIQNKSLLEHPATAPVLFALGEAYQRLGYPAKAAHIYRHSASTLNNALNATAGNPFMALTSAMAGMQCALNDQVVRLSGAHLTNGYMCDTPYHGISIFEVRFAQTAALLGKVNDLADYYRKVFKPSLDVKAPEGWLAPPVLPAKIRAHAVFADALEKMHQDDLALVAWERIAEDIAKFEDFNMSQTLISDTGSVTRDDFAKYLGRYMLLATQAKSAEKQIKALEYWLSFKGSAATQYKVGLNLLNQSGNRKLAQLLADADRQRVQVRQELLNNHSLDGLAIRNRMIEVSNDVFSARQEFVEKSSGAVDKEQGIQQSAKTILASIRNSLAPEAIFVDFAHTQSHDDESIYLMSVIDKSGGVRISIISGTNIDLALSELHRNIRAAISAGQIPAKETVDRPARALFDSVGNLLLDAMRQKLVLYVSPDGLLGSYPFEISADKTGSYPLSDKIISYVSAPRDFVTKMDDKEKTGATVVANPDYQGGLPPAVGANRYVGRGFQFPALPDTEAEAKFIHDLGGKQGFPTVSLSGASATKSALLNQPITGNILHFATHGFYFSDDPNGELGETTVARRFSDRNPLWRAGLAMAGANTDRTGGILYAAEVLRMNLKNTDIVVLSACDTGSGYFSAAEGVIGLTRAFTISGARSVISSKWPVSSAETVKFMEYLYAQNPGGTQTAKAMRNARLQMLTKFSNPYLWGAFTINQSGH